MCAPYTSMYVRVDPRNRLTIRAMSRDMGYAALKPQQQTIVYHISDVFISLPVGSGKWEVFVLEMVFETAKYKSPYLNIRTQGHVTFQFMYTEQIPAIHGIATIVTRRSSRTRRTSGSQD